MCWQIFYYICSSPATLRLYTSARLSSATPRRPASTETPGGERRSGLARPIRPPVTGVINHISYRIEPCDTDGVKAEFERRGLNPRPDMVGETFKSWHVLDPDGWDLQISNQTKASS